MSRSKKFLLGLAVLVVGSFAWRPLAIRLLLLRGLHQNLSSVAYFDPQLCRLGAAAQQPTLEAYARHRAQQDIAGFRMTVVHTLRCLRYQRATEVVGSPEIVRVRPADVPADPALFATIVDAFASEPSVQARGDQLLYMSELDYRAYFSIYAGYLGTEHSLPQLNASVPSVPGADDADDAVPNQEAIRVEWCRVLAAPIRRALQEQGTHGIWTGDAIDRLVRYNCAASDIALVASWIDSHQERASHEALNALFSALPHSYRARAYISAVLGLDLRCSFRHFLVREFARRLEGADADWLREQLAYPHATCAPPSLPLPSLDVEPAQIIHL